MAERKFDLNAIDALIQGKAPLAPASVVPEPAQTSVPTLRGGRLPQINLRCNTAEEAELYDWFQSRALDQKRQTGSGSARDLIFQAMREFRLRTNN